MENDKAIYVLFLIFAIAVMAGFYFVFDKISTLSTEVKNMELTLQIGNRETNVIPTPTSTPATPTTPLPTSTPVVVSTDIVIPTAIIFNALSSSALKPQATTTIMVENVSKADDGTIALSVKVFTSNATSYTAIDLKDQFWIINLNGDNEAASRVEGQFQSMPMKSSITGKVFFTPTKERNSFILQIGSGDEIKFYEFDFLKKTYTETEIG